MKKIMMLCLLSIFFFHGSAFSSVIFSDDFSDGVLAPWEIAMGTWTDTGLVLQGSGVSEPVFFCVLRRPVDRLHGAGEHPDF